MAVYGHLNPSNSRAYHQLYVCMNMYVQLKYSWMHFYMATSLNMWSNIIPSMATYVTHMKMNHYICDHLALCLNKAHLIPIPSLVPSLHSQLPLPAFFRMLYSTTCEKKLGVETGNEGTQSLILISLTTCIYPHIPQITIITHVNCSKYCNKAKKSCKDCMR